MGKIVSRTKGLKFYWRKGKTFDALRVQVHAVRENERSTFWIKASGDDAHKILKQINNYLKKKKLKESKAISDEHFSALKERLEEDLKSKYGLSSYIAQKKVVLKTKEFDFNTWVESFCKSKSKKVSCAYSYRQWLLNFWLPYFVDEQGCEHPKDFIQFRGFVEDHVQSAMTKNGELYSPHTYKSMTVPFNEFLKYLAKKGVIQDGEVFKVSVSVTLEQEKRGNDQRKRKVGHYSANELYDIKKKVDAQYAISKEDTKDEKLDKKKRKLQAYAIFLGCCMGLRRGNIIGLRVEDLFPENEIPHLVTKDNIVSGYSRGEEGAYRLVNATKAFKGRVELPFIQPDVDLLVEVAKYIKEHLKKGYILPGNSQFNTIHPDTLNKLWMRISKECGFKYINPHSFKHSYSTRGAAKLSEWYDRNPYFLQRCCMHAKFETTQKYIHQSEGDGFLDNFKSLRKRASGKT
jgi:integrase